MRRLPPRTLRGQLTAGLVTLLALACLAVGITTALALRGFLMGRLDEQLSASGGRFAASLEHEADPDADNRPDTRGQADATFGARLLDGHVTQAAVVDDATDRPLRLKPGEQRALAGIPVDGKGHSIRLSGLGEYRVTAVRGDDQDILITGLPLHPVEETVHRLQAVEAVLFAAALSATGIAGAVWVRFSLLPLQKVTARAAEVAGLPLASGEVAMPAPLPDTDPRTEVGRVGTALNHMLGHIEDALTRRHASEERLRHFAADASHELRTPVANIRGHAELALRHNAPLPTEVRHALERIDSESLRMTRLVDDLLLLARLDAGRPLEHEPVDLTLLILDATEDARAAGPGHHWFLDLPEEPVVVTGDAHRLQQAIGNLLANARTHTPAGTDVTITLTRQQSTVLVDVSDNGPGIPDTLQADVFGRFVRADHARSRSTGSTGLGLAIVHAVITAHGGTATVTSSPGHTTFRLTLPGQVY
ncbi:MULTISPECIES: sensor histidine kinase [Streptomyces]|uniref:histidine kinase n=1 Tax=Streptomyces scabiei (strain 87.22) TaxID=680198 RepID=C9Z3J9_STRSW|nr:MULTISPECIES: ATP-binding protein [Streptomyces]MBP5871462.1 HAMP domain-containing histidine kinase [Streptomyces sp. LBUM 1485]MBP5927232.1 HAMP domain-containing histidine kinase [Streptomyces sp. LBUM 1479]KFG06287.1 histidine kinase [Streptomyces scabiei]MBP5879904.1 HAMP domain-containing histidine kinase [Streptomyces sp. LBUM 1477]MBP5887732.1 HAMP domain-containing histidine kinase [Streptomyces sp. LBUM 1487]